MIYVGLDVDGVLRNFADQVTKQFKEDFPEVTSEVKPIVTYPLEPSFPLPAPYLKAWWQRIRGTKIMCEAIPYDGALEFADKLWRLTEEYGAKLRIVSHQSDNLKEPTIHWLEFYKINYDDIFFAEDKHRLGLSYMIDDSTRVLEKFPKSQAICVARPWNTDYSGARMTYAGIVERLGHQIRSR